MYWPASFGTRVDQSESVRLFGHLSPNADYRPVIFSTASGRRSLSIDFNCFLMTLVVSDGRLFIFFIIPPSAALSVFRSLLKHCRG